MLFKVGKQRLSALEKKTYLDRLFLTRGYCGLHITQLCGSYAFTRLSSELVSLLQSSVEEVLGS